jgi:DNA/RNA-binding domain of Phe-tRNA-synthetase-like protein
VAQLAVREGRDLGSVMDMVIRGALQHLSRSFPDGDLDRGSAVTAVREHLKHLGIDPQATPPSSELLISSFIEAEEIPRGSLAWEFLAVLTVKSQVPWSAIHRERLQPPLRFRLGQQGEGIATGKDDFDCARLPVLADQEGVKGSPWVPCAPRDLEGCTDPVFVCYLPEGLFRATDPKSHLGRIVWLTWAFQFVFERSYSFKRGLA